MVEASKKRNRHYKVFINGTLQGTVVTTSPAEAVYLTMTGMGYSILKKNIKAGRTFAKNNSNNVIQAYVALVTKGSYSSESYYTIMLDNKQEGKSMASREHKYLVEMYTNGKMNDLRIRELIIAKTPVDAIIKVTEKYGFKRGRNNIAKRDEVSIKRSPIHVAKVGLVDGVGKVTVNYYEVG